MAGNTLMERWASDDDPLAAVSGPKKDRNPIAWAALVPTNMNGEAPEDVREAERAAVLEWLEGKLTPTNDVAPYIMAYIQYVSQGCRPKPDFVPDIDLAEFLPMKKV